MLRVALLSTLQTNSVRNTLQPLRRTHDTALEIFNVKNITRYRRKPLQDIGKVGELKIYQAKATRVEQGGGEEKEEEEEE
jgi:hypothetical protein